jgi:hypothetical protein
MRTTGLSSREFSFQNVGQVFQPAVRLESPTYMEKPIARPKHHLSCRIATARIRPRQLDVAIVWTGLHDGQDELRTAGNPKADPVHPGILSFPPYLPEIRFFMTGSSSKWPFKVERNSFRFTRFAPFSSLINPPMPKTE